MSDEEFNSLRKRVSDRLEAGSRRLNERLDRPVSKGVPQSEPSPSTRPDQTAMQSASELTSEDAAPQPIGMPTSFGNDDAAEAGRPEAPSGGWRCIVESKWVTIDLTANIAAEGTLSGQGTLIYKVTNKVFNVSGGGEWTALPPDQASPNWLFHFSLRPSNHAMFSWFAAPTDSPNHLRNRFVSPQTGSVVTTHCERIG